MTAREATREEVSRLIDRAQQDNDAELVKRLQWVIDFIDGKPQRSRSALARENVTHLRGTGGYR